MPSGTLMAHLVNRVPGQDMPVFSLFNAYLWQITRFLALIATGGGYNIDTITNR